MNKTARTIIVGLLAVLMVMGLAVPGFATIGGKEIGAYYNDIVVTVDGDVIVPKNEQGEEVEPFLVDGTTYLPLRGISEALGYDVQWDEENWTAVITSPEGTLTAEDYYTLGVAIKDNGLEEYGELAGQCFKRAADLGSADALNQYGECILRGWVPAYADYSDEELGEAVLEIFEEAAEAGCNTGYHNIGLLYLNTVSVPGTDGGGIGLVAYDGEKAFEYFTKGNAAGNNKSTRYLGICYEYGHGVDVDYEEAYAWYEQAGANLYLGKLLLEGKGCEQDVPRAIELLDQMARSTGGNRDESMEAKLILGELYTNGDYGVTADPDLALEYYILAAQENNEEAIEFVAAYAAGLVEAAEAIIDSDPAEAYKLLYRAAELGDGDALAYFQD